MVVGEVSPFVLGSNVGIDLSDPTTNTRGHRETHVVQTPYNYKSVLLNVTEYIQVFSHFGNINVDPPFSGTR